MHNPYVSPYNLPPMSHRPKQRRRIPYPYQEPMPYPPSQHVQSHEMTEQVDQLGARQQLLMEEAIQIARQHVPGQVVEAELEYKHGRYIFEVDTVTSQGVKYEVEIDANTGEVIEISID